MFGIVCEQENVADDEVHLEHPYSVATAGLIRVSKNMMTVPPLYFFKELKRKACDISQNYLTGLSKLKK